MTNKSKVTANPMTKLSLKNLHTFKKSSIAIMILSVIVLFLCGYTLFLGREVRRSLDNPAGLGMTIAAAVDGLNKPLPVHAETGNLFLPETRLVLPPTTHELGEFVYSHIPNDSEANAELSIASQLLIERSKVAVVGAVTAAESLEAVPKLQACARGFKVYLQEKADFDGTKVFEKTLNDGRKIFAYQEDGCSDQREELVAYLEQIQSY